MKKKYFSLFFFIAFLVSFCIVGITLNNITKMKWNYESYNAAQQIVQGYYLEKEDSLDVLILGASTMRNGMSPLTMFEEYGFTSYSRATSVQPAFISYYLLKETLDKHKIKAVIMDASGLFTVTNNVSDMDGKIHEAVDYMKFSKHKVELINYLSCNGYNKLDFYFPLYKYHERWSDISKDDFTYKEWQKEYYYKGQYPNIFVEEIKFPEDYMKNNENNDDLITYNGTSLEYYDKITNLCKENNIELILIKTPIINWSLRKNELVQQYADINNITFIDFNLEKYRKKIEFNEKQDFSDFGKHVNISGANKMSQYIGSIIVERCNVYDKRQDESYNSWNNDLDKYKRVIHNMKIKNADNLEYIFQNIDDNYTIIIAARDESKKQFEEIDSILRENSLIGNIYNEDYVGYIAIICNGSILYNDVRCGQHVYFNGVVNEMKLSVLSYADRVSGNTASIVIDGKECSPQKEGINIVIYDNYLNKLIAKRSYNEGFEKKNDREEKQ